MFQKQVPYLLQAVEPNDVCISGLIGRLFIWEIWIICKMAASSDITDGPILADKAMLF